MRERSAAIRTSHGASHVVSPALVLFGTDVQRRTFDGPAYLTGTAQRKWSERRCVAPVYLQGVLSVAQTCPRQK